MSRITAIKLSTTIANNVGTDTSKTVGGRILAVLIDYPAATCTVDLDSQSELKDQKILDLAAANTDRAVYPRTLLQDNTGTDIDLSDGQGGDTALYGHFVVYGRLKLSVASGTNGQIVNMTVIMEEF